MKKIISAIFLSFFIILSNSNFSLSYVDEHVQLVREYSALNRINSANRTREQCLRFNAILEQGGSKNLDLSHADLRELYLSNGIFNGTNFNGSNLSMAQLARATAIEVNFCEAKLDKVNLGQARLGKSNFSKASLMGACFAGAYLQEAQFVGANLREAGFCKAKLEGVSFEAADLRGAQFSSKSLEAGPNLENALVISMDVVFTNNQTRPAAELPAEYPCLTHAIKTPEELIAAMRTGIHAFIEEVKIRDFTAALPDASRKECESMALLFGKPAEIALVAPQVDVFQILPPELHVALGTFMDLETKKTLALAFSGKPKALKNKDDENIIGPVVRVCLVDEHFYDQARQLLEMMCVSDEELLAKLESRYAGGFEVFMQYILPQRKFDQVDGLYKWDEFCSSTDKNWMWRLFQTKFATNSN